MVGARSAAMGFNRLADHDIDARNPRTSGRELPSGRLARLHVWSFVALSAAAFVAAAVALNPLCGVLSPVALAVVFGYSYTKRFTSLSHLVLGLALAIAPVGAWLAIRGSFAVVPFLVGFGVLFWVAGFDIIYSCQDADFDRGAGLRSLPARFGVATALGIARGLHVLAVASLAVGLLVPSAAPRLPPRRGAGGAAARLRALPGERLRPVARERRVLHRERLDQRPVPRGHRDRPRPSIIRRWPW